MNLTIQKLLYYSLDETITLGKLKKAEWFSAPQQTLLQSPSAQHLTQWMNNHQVMGISEEMDTYHQKFSHTKQPPYLLYACGNLDILNQNILGIVGPREMSPYAEKVLEAFFTAAAHTPFVTVSGLARGVDQKCHQLSLLHHIPTIAILGGGLRRYLQSSWRNLITEIVEQGGLVLSEFKLDFKPTKWSFPQRNRLIAGLSDVLLLPEAREWSGSLITAQFASEMGKEIFVAPNQLFSPNGLGANLLIENGKAHMLTDFSKLLKKFPDAQLPTQASPEPRLVLSAEENDLLKLVHRYAHQELSSWSVSTSWDFGELLSQLTMLEMKGVIGQSDPWCYFVR